MPYNAFISYSHSADGERAPALHSALHRFAKPWYKPRALRIFRDQINLSVSPSLWKTIQGALDDSAFFILLASPKASASDWVQKEIEYWCANRELRKLLIVLTSGNIVWDASKADFDWEQTTSLPKLLSGKFADEPLWVDLSWAVGNEQLSLRHIQFRSSIATLAATLHDRPKDELDSEDVRENRKVKRLTRGAISALALLSLVAGALAWLFYAQYKVAEERRRISMSRQLAAQSRLYLDDKLDLALLLASEANHIADTPEAQAALFDALHHNSRLVAFLHGHVGFIKSLTYSSDGTLMASGDSSGQIRLWNMDTHESVGQPIAAHQGAYGRGVEHLVFSPDSKVLVSGGSDGAVRLWSIPEGTQLAEQAQAAKGLGITGIAVSPHGKYVAVTMDTEDVIMLLDGHTLASIGQPLNVGKGLRFGRGTEGNIVFSPNEEKLAFVSNVLHSVNKIADVYDAQPYILVYDVSKRVAVTKIKTTSSVEGLTFSADGSNLIIGKGDGSIESCDVKGSAPATQVTQAAKLLQNATSRRALSLRGKVLAVASDDGAVTIWDLQNNRLMDDPIKIGAGLIWYIQISPDASTLALGERNGPIQIWSLKERTYLPPSVAKYENTVLRRALSPDGRILATIPKAGTQDKMGTLRFWETQTKTTVGEPFETNTFIFNFAFSSDGKVIAAASGVSVYFWDLESRAQIYQPIHVDDFVFNVAFSPDGKILAIGAFNKILLWSIQENSLIGQPTVMSQGGVWSLAFSPDSKTLATCGDDGSVLFWEVGESGLTAQPVSGRAAEKNARSVAFSRDGRLLVVGAEDGSIWLWDVKYRHALGSVPKAAPSGLWSLAFEGDGKRLISAEEEGSIRVWEIGSLAWQSSARRLANRSLNTDERQQFIGDGF